MGNFISAIKIELVLKCVKKNGLILRYVPGHLKTEDNCLIAVQQNGKALRYVPEHFRTEELCLAAVQQDVWAFYYVPEHLKTEEVCLAAVTKDGTTLESVPEYLKTTKLCLIAVKQNGLSLEYVPEHLQTKKIIKAALFQEPYSKIYINKKSTIRYNGKAKQMPEKAYDTLQMGYDEETSIKDGDLMVDFHSEFEYGRFYRKKTFDTLILPSMKNFYTNEKITEYIIYEASV